MKEARNFSRSSTVSKKHKQPVNPKVLSITSMFPNPAMPHFGIFVLRRLKAARKYADISVIHPVPYFPGATALAKYKYRDKIPTRYTIEDINVSAPRYLSVPGICKPIDGLTMSWAVDKDCGNRFIYDLIDAQLAFPDGYSAALLSARFGVPFVVTLRGHDINVLPSLPVRGKLVREVLLKASRIMGVSQSLIDEAIRLGAAPERCEAIPNGVSLELFFPRDKKESKQSLNLDPEFRYILSVGHLIERKGHHLIVEALSLLRKEERFRNLKLVIAGSESIEGNYCREIQETLESHGMREHVILAGAVPQEKLGLWYAASECLCLASSKEGWANVLLESLACGRPVVATAVWGTPEVITENLHGVLVERTVKSIHEGLAKLLSKKWNIEVLVNRASDFTWDKSGSRLVANYEMALQNHALGRVDI
jgi:glycosyltransferase involved in cell wall biosynthesis